MNHVIPKFIFGAALASGCQSADMPPGKCGTLLEKIAARNPIVEAEAVARSAAPYVLAVQGYSVSFPGVDDAQFAMKIGYRTLEGTGDAIRDDSCRVYQQQAKHFAERFNRRLIAVLQMAE